MNNESRGHTELRPQATSPSQFSLPDPYMGLGKLDVPNGASAGAGGVDLPRRWSKTSLMLDSSACITPPYSASDRFFGDPEGGPAPALMSRQAVGLQRYMRDLNSKSLLGLPLCEQICRYFYTDGLATDEGLVAKVREELERRAVRIQVW